MNLKRLSILTAAVSTAVLTGAGIALAEQKVALEDLPEAVRTTVLEHAGSVPIEEIEIDTESGHVVYDVEQKINGKEVEFMVAEDGTYLGLEDDEDEDEGETKITAADLPAAVSEALAAYAGTRTPKELERSSDDGHVLYEAEYDVDGVEQSVVMTADGEITATEQGIAADQLPAAVAAKVQRFGADATIKEAEVCTLTFYEVEVVSNGKKHTVRVLANGQGLHDDDDDHEHGEHHDDDDDDK